MSVQVRVAVVVFWALLAVVCLILPWPVAHLVAVGAAVVALLAVLPAPSESQQSRR